MHVFGTETHMTAIVGMALGKTEIPDQEPFDSNDAATMFFDSAEVLSCEFCPLFIPSLLFLAHPVLGEL